MMAAYYLDSSDLAKRYMVETGTAWITSITNQVAVTTNILKQAIERVKRQPLRAYDAIQLGVALAIHTRRDKRDLSPLIFLSADQNLNQAAANEGFAVDDPNQHP